jgi:hypothetical protein
MEKKAAWVLGMMASRMRGLGVSWKDATVAQAYTVEDISGVIAQIQGTIGPGSLTWHWCRPPIEGLDYEMDARGVSVERVLA